MRELFGYSDHDVIIIMLGFLFGMRIIDAIKGAVMQRWKNR